MTALHDKDEDRRPAMPCPNCSLDSVQPMLGSTLIVAWYRCELCGYFWSARVRDGRPIAEVDAT